MEEKDLIEYIAADMKDDDLVRLMDQFAADPEEKDEAVSMKIAEIQAKAFLTPESDVETAWKKTRIRRNVRRRRWIAASVAASAVLALGSFFLGAIKDRLPTYLANDTIIETEPGQRSLLTLPDGTKVHLNECSKIIYNSSSWNESRTVRLYGQASFDVRHIDEIPFSVHTESFTVKDIGTTFEISGYDGDEWHYVHLTSGEAAVDFFGSERSIVLMPGQIVTLNIKTGEIRKRKSEEGHGQFGWQGGCLSFDNNTLLEKSAQLYRHFGYTFNISKECDTYRYTAVFDNDSITELMAIIKTMTPSIRYSINQNTKTVTVWETGKR